VDARVREAVEAKLRALGQTNPQEAFKNNSNLPTLGNRHGDPVPIRRVRICISGSPRQIGTGARARHVQGRDNHHLAVYRRPPDRKGVGRWTGQTVSLLDAVLRKRLGRPVIAPVNEAGAPLVMAIYKGDMVEMTVPKSQPAERDLFVIRSFSLEGSRPDIHTARHNLAAEKKELMKRGEWTRIRSWDEFRLLDPRVVRLDPVGRVVVDGGQPDS
jgi:hypothetical protein